MFLKNIDFMFRKPALSLPLLGAVKKGFYLYIFCSVSITTEFFTV